MEPMRGVVLAYHSQNCGGFDYTDNDHIALASDLAAIRQRGLPIVSCHSIARALTNPGIEHLPERFVALSCDDGTLLDWRDYDHPEYGVQRAFANILRDELAAGLQAELPALTAFVIASPEARHAIDQGCYGGAPLSDDDWWPQAMAEGLLAIENHSWDHLHACLPEAIRGQGTSGDFYSVNDKTLADQQVLAAKAEIDCRLGQGAQPSSLFAYPYGHASDYLVQEYFPQFGSPAGIVGAFTTEQACVTADTSPFNIPRLVCGDAWVSAGEFDQVLDRLS